MSTQSKSEKIDACRELYFKYGGLGHERIASEMRFLGWSDFSRRVFYARGNKPGWPERYGWNVQSSDVQSSSFSLSLTRNLKVEL